jgi:polyhydroxyalkanoate synthase
MIWGRGGNKPGIGHVSCLLDAQIEGAAVPMPSGGGDDMNMADSKQQMANRPGIFQFGAVPQSLFGAAGPFANAMKSFNPFALFGHNVALARDMVQIAMGSSPITPDPRDWRFQDETWTKNPFYHRLAQAYLAMTDAVEKMIPDDLSGDARARAQLASDIVTSAFSPTNSLLGNPAAVMRAIETRGGSLAHGFRNFVDDWLNNEGMPSQVDTSSFEVGRNLAITPGKVVYRTAMFELIEYKPAADTIYQTPSLLIPPQIGRYYFTDLSPGRSFAEYVVSRGLHHFVVSWRNPGVEQRDWGLDQYIGAAIDAIEKVAEISGQPKINLISFCAGGILSALAAGVLAAQGRDLINTLALCVTMLNWQTDATIGAFRLPMMLSVAQARSKMNGVLSGTDLHKVFTWLRPNDLVWNYWVNNYLMGDTPPAFDILAWNKDSTNLPATLHEDFLQIFQKNELIEPGKFEALGEKIDLGSITCDNFVVGAVTDHLTPWTACYQACGFLGGHSTFALSNGGHIAALVNPPSNPKAHHWIGPGTAETAEEWQACATRRKGSWWEGWADWVIERSGERIPAPRTLGSAKYLPLVDAPGEYVHS